MTDRLKELSKAGVSIWLDDLSRDRLSSGNLQGLIDNSHVVGVTTNPAIFDKAIASGSDAYADQVTGAKARGLSVDEAIRTMTTYDVRWACDLFHKIYEKSHGYDGRVSIEVDPRFARNTDATIAEAAALHFAVDRENVLIKIPGTKEGLPAITATIAAGISVNVTLIFSVDRYLEVMDAWMTGLEQAQAAGRDLKKIHSVASFFVSRVDSAVDKELAAIGSAEAHELRGQLGIANARLAYAAFEELLDSDRWQALEKAGARVQRPLWASTGVKDPDYSDDRYVVRLAAKQVVNTMPEATMEAVAAHGDIEGDTITGNYEDAKEVFRKVRDLGVDLDAVFDALEEEGVVKFVDAWQDLINNVESAIS